MSEVIARYNEFDSFHSEQMDELSILQALQMEEDAKIALDLQFMERQRAGQQANSKYFTVLEKVLHVQSL